MFSRTLRRLVLPALAAVSCLAGLVSAQATGIANQCYGVTARALFPVIPQGATEYIVASGSCPVPGPHGVLTQGAQFRLWLQQPGGVRFVESDFVAAPGAAVLFRVPTQPRQGANTWTYTVDACPWTAPAGCAGPITTVSGTFTLR